MHTDVHSFVSNYVNRKPSEVNYKSEGTLISTPNSKSINTLMATPSSKSDCTPMGTLKGTPNKGSRRGKL